MRGSEGGIEKYLSYDGFPLLYFVGLPRHGHQQHRGVQPLHQGEQLVQAWRGQEEVQGTRQDGQALQVSR